MNRLPALILLLFASILYSCESENATTNQKTDVTMHVKGTFGSQPLLMYAQEYPYEAGMRLKFQLFQFYLSDLALLKRTNTGMDTVKILDIGLVTFEDIQNAAQAQSGYSIALKDVPVGKYDGISFGLGVSPVLNATSPGSYTPPHPLDGNYWSWARGYIFTKVEGYADLTGSGAFNTPLTFHIGENEFYRQKTILQPLELSASHPHLELQVDLRRVLVADASNFLDFRKVTQDHTVNRDIAKFISDNLQAAVSMPVQ